MQSPVKRVIDSITDLTYTEAINLIHGMSLGVAYLQTRDHAPIRHWVEHEADLDLAEYITEDFAVELRSYGRNGIPSFHY